MVHEEFFWETLEVGEHLEPPLHLDPAQLRRLLDTLPAAAEPHGAPSKPEARGPHKATNSSCGCPS